MYCFGQQVPNPDQDLKGSTAVVGPAVPKRAQSISWSSITANSLASSSTTSGISSGTESSSSSSGERSRLSGARITAGRRAVPASRSFVILPDDDDDVDENNHAAAKFRIKDGSWPPAAVSSAAAGSSDTVPGNMSDGQDSKTDQHEQQQQQQQPQGQQQDKHQDQARGFFVLPTEVRDPDHEPQQDQHSAARGATASLSSRSSNRNRGPRAAATTAATVKDSRAWGSSTHLKAILEGSDEDSFYSSPGPIVARSYENVRKADAARRSRTSEPPALGRHNPRTPGKKAKRHNQTKAGTKGSGTAAPWSGSESDDVDVDLADVADDDRSGFGGNQMTSRRRAEFFETCFHPQARICSNIKFNLHNFRTKSQKEAYMAVVEAIAVGPETVRASEAERILGINQEVFLKSKARRKATLAREGYDEFMDDLDYESPGNLKLGKDAGGDLYYYDAGDRRNTNRAAGKSRGTAGGTGLTAVGYGPFAQNKLAPAPAALRDVFGTFSRFGDPHSTGHHITLTQNDKWMRQAGILDNWNVTPTDTAISFRKLGRGSKWLDYETWRLFLEDFAWRKRIHHDFMIDKLISAGKQLTSQQPFAGDNVDSDSRQLDRDEQHQQRRFYAGF